jgi:hypothetical protein
MPTEFDAEAGVLRLGHAALAVLARLAVDPTDRSLTDHATAPPLAALRSAGIVGPAGIAPAVRPLAAVLGAPRAMLDLELHEGAIIQRARGWATDDLVVLGLPVPTGEDAWDLVAEVPGEAPALIGDVVGLVPGPPAAAEAVAIDVATAEALLGGPAASAAAVDPRLRAIADGVRVRWRLAVRDVGDLEVVDAGDAGLWVLEGGAAGLVLSATDPAALRAAIGDLLGRALRRT